MMETTEAEIRLAFRTEGNMVRCYLARAKTMDGSFLINSLPKRLFEAEPELFEEWKEFMKKVFGVLVREALGASVESWYEGPAPDIERGGNA